MVTLIKYGALSGGEKYNADILSIDGLSTDTKPSNYFIEYDNNGVEISQKKIPNGSTYTEVDTGNTYMYDIGNTIWHKVSLNGGNVDGHYVPGANINITPNADGTETISASGEISSEDGVARQSIANHIADESNPHKVTKAQVGLGNVDNTADLDKPVSTAAQKALNSKANAVDVYTKAEVDSIVDGIIVPTTLADLSSDTTHRVVTDTEKATWNSKQNEINDIETIRAGATLGATAVQPEIGKGLSTNDYTTADKTKLTNLVNIKSIGDGLSFDETTGELDTKGDSGTTDYSDLTNKPQINGITLTGNKTSAQLGLAAVSDIPTTFAELSDDSTHRVVTDTEKATWNNKADVSDIPDVPIKGIERNNTTITPDSSGIVNIVVPTTASDVSALPNTTKYAASMTLSVNTTTFVITATLKDQNGDTLGTVQTIDLPLESVVVNGSYDNTTKKVILTLKSGSTISFSVADLVSGLQAEITSANKLDADLVDDTLSTHKFVTAANKSTWDAKQDALTTTQLNAVNSGITSSGVSQIATNANNIASINQTIGDINSVLEEVL